MRERDVFEARVGRLKSLTIIPVCVSGVLLFGFLPYHKARAGDLLEVPIPVWFVLAGSALMAIASGLGAVLVLVRALIVRGPVVTADENGLRDRRISDTVIPWSKIKSIERRVHKKPAYLGAYLDSEFEPTLVPNRLWNVLGRNYKRSAMSRALGLSSITVSAMDLNVSFATLADEIESRWEQHADAEISAQDLPIMSDRPRRAPWIGLKLKFWGITIGLFAALNMFDWPPGAWPYLLIGSFLTAFVGLIAVVLIDHRRKKSREQGQ